jgi:hypothetical protein
MKALGANLSVWINTRILLGRPHEGLSARAGRWQDEGRRYGNLAAGLIDVLASHGHCARHHYRLKIRARP